MAAENRKIHGVYICRLCGHEINDAGACNFGCVQDFMYPKNRPSGTVTLKTYELILLTEENL